VNSADYPSFVAEQVGEQTAALEAFGLARQN